MKKWKGIVLGGLASTLLSTITRATSKKLLLVYGKLLNLIAGN